MAASSTITIRLDDGSIVDRPINQTGIVSVITWTVPLVSAPLLNSMWGITDPIVEPMLARVVGIGQGDGGTEFTITALKHNPSKYGMIENNTKLQSQQITPITKLVAAPTNIQIQDSAYEISPGVFGIKTLVSWTGSEQSYTIGWRSVDGQQSNWNSVSISVPSFDLYDVKGEYEFKLFATSFLGLKSQDVSFTHVVGLTTTTPAAVVNLALVGGSWTTPTCYLTWDAVTQALGYDVETWSGLVKRRTDRVSGANYAYTLDMNAQDTITRDLHFKVYAVSGINGLRSATPASIVAFNAQMGAIASPSLSPTVFGITVTYDQPTASDWAGVMVWASKTSGFTPGAGTLKFAGMASTVSISSVPLDPADVWYVRIGAYDVFGADSMALSSELSGNPLALPAVGPNSIVSVNIAAGAVTAEKIKTKQHMIF